MPTYAGSRLAATGNVTGREKRAVRRALDKRIRTTFNEKLMMEVEMSIPNDVTDIRADKQRVAEVVVKLISKLKEGPLVEAKTDEQWLNGAIKFLVTDLGKGWMRSWFQPHTVENGSAFVMPTVVTGKAKAKSTVQEFSRREGQGCLSNTSSAQHLGAPIGLMPHLQTSVRDGSGAIPRGTTPPGSQLLELSAETVPLSPTLNGSTTSTVSLQPVLDSTSIQVSAPDDVMYSPLANEVVRTLARLGLGTSQHQRSSGDPGQVHMCLKYHKFHWMSNGTSHPAVFLISEANSAAGGMQVQQVKRNESWAVWMMGHALTPVNAVAWLLLCMFLALLSKSYPRN